MKFIRTLAIAVFWTSVPVIVIAYAEFIAQHDKAMASAYAGK